MPDDVRYDTSLYNTVDIDDFLLKSMIVFALILIGSTTTALYGNDVNFARRLEQLSAIDKLMGMLKTNLQSNPY